MLKSILILAFLAASAHAVCDYTFSTPTEWTTGLDGALKGNFDGYTLCSGQDLMARFKEFKNNNNLPTTVHEYRNFWAFAVDYVFMDEFLRFAQIAASTAGGNLDVARDLFTRNVNTAVGVDPVNPDTRYTYYMIAFRKSNMVNAASIYNHYPPTWDNLFTQHRNLIPCTWQNGADQCNAALNITFGQQVEFDLKNTLANQICMTSDEFYGVTAPTTADCKEFRTYAETFEGVRNNQGGVLAVSDYVSDMQQQGTVINFLQARAYFYVACSATYDFQGDGFVFNNAPANEFVVRGDVPLDQLDGTYYVVLPHAFAEEPAEPAQRRLHPKISLNTFRGSA